MKLLKFTTLISLALINCSINGCGTVSNEAPLIIGSNVKTDIKENTHIIDLGAGKQVTGNKITVKIDFSRNFTAKASYNGISPQTSQDIQSYQIYLIKNVAAPPFPPGGDPLKPANIVAGPFTINTDARISEKVEFINITDSSNDFYYAAVRAFNGSGSDIIKKDNGSITPWTLTTAGAPFFGHVAVSTTAVQIDSNNKVVAPNNTLNVIPKLFDALGTAVEEKIVFSGPFSLVRTYETDLTTNSLQPFISKVGAFGSPISKSIQAPYQLSDNDETDVINNIPVGGPYFATVAAFGKRLDGAGGTEKFNITKPNNGGSPYNSTDLNARVAVSGASVSVSASQALNFSPANFNFLDISLNLATGLINTIAGNGNAGFSGDSVPAFFDSRLSNPTGAVDFDSSGNVYFADTGNNRVRMIDIETGMISTVAGDGTACPALSTCGDGASAITAKLNNPSGITIAPNGDIYIADTGNNRIRKVDASNGKIGNVAGDSNSNPGYTGDGSQNANVSKLFQPQAVALDNLGNVYVADTGNHVIRKFPIVGGIINLFAGKGQASGFGGDLLPATGLLARLDTPTGIAIDNLSGNVYIADKNNNLIRMVSGGILTTVAGNVLGLPLNFGYLLGDEGNPAILATLTAPYSVAVDKVGDVYIADSGNDVIRKFTPGGNIDRVAGLNSSPCTTSTGVCGDLTSVASLKSPKGIIEDKLGNIYITDTGTNRIRKVYVAD